MPWQGHDHCMRFYAEMLRVLRLPSSLMARSRHLWHMGGTIIVLNSSFSGRCTKKYCAAVIAARHGTDGKQGLMQEGALRQGMKACLHT